MPCALLLLVVSVLLANALRVRLDARAMLFEGGRVQAADVLRAAAIDHRLEAALWNTRIHPRSAASDSRETSVREKHSVHAHVHGAPAELASAPPLSLVRTVSLPLAGIYAEMHLPWHSERVPARMWGADMPAAFLDAVLPVAAVQTEPGGRAWLVHRALAGLSCPVLAADAWDPRMFSPSERRVLLSHVAARQLGRVAGWAWCARVFPSAVKKWGDVRVMLGGGRWAVLLLPQCLRHWPHAASTALVGHLSSVFAVSEHPPGTAQGTEGALGTRAVPAAEKAIGTERVMVTPSVHFRLDRDDDEVACRMDAAMSTEEPFDGIALEDVEATLALHVLATDGTDVVRATDTVRIASICTDLPAHRQASVLGALIFEAASAHDDAALALIVALAEPFAAAIAPYAAQEMLLCAFPEAMPGSSLPPWPTKTAAAVLASRAWRSVLGDAHETHVPLRLWAPPKRLAAWRSLVLRQAPPGNTAGVLAVHAGAALRGAGRIAPGMRMDGPPRARAAVAVDVVQAYLSDAAAAPRGVHFVRASYVREPRSPSCASPDSPSSTSDGSDGQSAASPHETYVLASTRARGMPRSAFCRRPRAASLAHLSQRHRLERDARAASDSPQKPPPQRAPTAAGGVLELRVECHRNPQHSIETVLVALAAHVAIGTLGRMPLGPPVVDLVCDERAFRSRTLRRGTALHKPPHSLSRVPWDDTDDDDASPMGSAAQSTIRSHDLGLATRALCIHADKHALLLDRVHAVRRVLVAMGMLPFVCPFGGRDDATHPSLFLGF